MSTNDAVFYRRNKQIQDAIDSQNLKQALQLIDKRIKKGEDTRFLKAWKAHILFRHADETQRQRGVSDTLSLCKADPPTTDLDTLDILYQTLQKMGGQEETMRSIWEKASKAKSQDLDLQMRWFTYAFEGDDWKSAQKAAMTLQNNFPKTRKYYLWAIFLSYMVAVDETSSDGDRKLFGTLAYRMVSKAAESVPSDPKELLSPPRAIQSSEELLLLIKIFESQERHAEILKILDSENLGLSSRVIQNDWTFVGVKVSSLEKAESWTEGLAYARSLLSIPSNDEERKALQERDDWVVWSLLVKAARGIDTPETTAEVQNFINEFIRFEPKSRNAQLAHLDLLDWTFESGSANAEDLVCACEGYFDSNKHKLYCFGDLLAYLPKLDESSRLRFVKYASNSQDEKERKNDPHKGVATINALKFEYCLLLSADASNASKPKVEDFVSRCLQIYRETDRPENSETPSAIESQPSDDLCLLAAMSLIRFSGAWITGNQDKEAPDTALIRAAAILDRLLVDSPHNYQGLLLLVRIYLRLGAGSLALKTFSKLSVKQMQFETVAHNLFTRLATIHPHSAPPIDGAEYKDFNPQSAFVQALNFYRNAEATSVRHRSSGLEYGSYVNIESTIELQRRLRQSICRRMWALDVKRIHRLANGDPVSRYDEIARDTSPLSDQRIFDAFMNCEIPGQPTFEERIRLGPLPQGQWVKSTRITEHLFTVLRSISLQKSVSDMEIPSLEDVIDSGAASEMTGAEIESAKVNINLLKLVKYLSGSKSISCEQAEGFLDEVQNWLDCKAKELGMNNSKVSPLMSTTAISLQPTTPLAPSWKTFHTLYLSFECLKAVSGVSAIALKKGSKAAKLPKERVERLVNTMRQVDGDIRSNIRALKSRLSESGVLGSLIDLVVGGEGNGEDGPQLRDEIEKTLDMSSLELFCGELMESWEEGLGGVLAVRL
ncbi:hypothetical protein FE257_002226 [Aspergillus nanangensis]|uniref:Cytoskeleton organization protein n=1 Tax=Aspergillus nanangensis TaxID=2582783 RepID=A0AAD4CDA4_ASPNN|nr:hypothetical protein FE257_002226 [Aspergillus nanangensis]